MTNERPSALDFSPHAFLKSRRPGRFSDSSKQAIVALDRSALDYHLDSLTSRSQEADFERFAIRLIKATICPNLLPQTGPTGGGDSKVDSETYPVAEELSLLWHVGFQSEAGSQRWAFAFSAKKRWRGKVRSDIAKIAGTKREYKNAFFVTNQWVRDKTRAELEDNLRNKHGLDVRILDRSWVLNAVLADGNERIAVEELHISGERLSNVLGHLDVSREQRLKEIESRISSIDNHRQHGFQLTEDAIEAAMLVRGLERPRSEIENMLLRARGIADRYGTVAQRIKIAYQEAWTAYWWFEDRDVFVNSYGIVESLAIGTPNPRHLELLSNLWSILQTEVAAGRLDSGEAEIVERTKTLENELERLEREPNRESSSLRAKTLRLTMRLVTADQGGVGEIFDALTGVIEESRGLVNYPLESLVELIQELARIGSNLPEFDHLFETAVDAAGERNGEIVAARMLVERGTGQLNNEEYYKAIGTLGRALTRLFKDESRDDIVRALYLCSAAYQAVGLKWAARGTVITAASLATDEFWIDGSITPHQAACYQRVMWIELELGRLAHALAWYEVEQHILSVLVDAGHPIEELTNSDRIFDGVVGVHMLKANRCQLEQLERFPDVLSVLNLENAAQALIYALGHEENMPYGREGEDLRAFFVSWRDQPASTELQPLSIAEDVKSVVSSRVLGCEITIESGPETSATYLAESIIAAIESLLATGLEKTLVAREPSLTLFVTATSADDLSMDFVLNDRNGLPHFDITCGNFDPHHLSRKVQASIKNKLRDLLATIIARVFYSPNFEQTLEDLLGNEQAFDRSLGFTSSFITVGNVLGDDPKTGITDWLTEDSDVYEMVRTEQWDFHDINQSLVEKTEGSERPGEIKDHAQKPSDFETKLSNVRQEHVRNVSVVRETLWNRAGWEGVAYVSFPNDDLPPILALMFRNEEAGRQIFAGWHSEFGSEVFGSRVRLTIIRGIDSSNPTHYRVVITSNIEKPDSRGEARYLVIPARIHTMEPSSDVNLRRFIDSYNSIGLFGLARSFRTDDSDAPSIDFEYVFPIDEFNLREAWEISDGDFDAIGIQPEDDPIIPKDQPDAPVNELMLKIRAD